MKKITPSENYKGLLIQFKAIERILECKQAELSIYQKTIKRFSIDRIIQLEAELESEKRMNNILTEELENYEKQNTKNLA